MPKYEPFSAADRPIVEQEQTFIHTSGTDRMEVVCTVHASPKAKVGDKKLLKIPFDRAVHDMYFNPRRFGGSRTAPHSARMRGSPRSVVTGTRCCCPGSGGAPSATTSAGPRTSTAKTAAPPGSQVSLW